MPLNMCQKLQLHIQTYKNIKNEQNLKGNQPKTNSVFDNDSIARGDNDAERGQATGNFPFAMSRLINRPTHLKHSSCERGDSDVHN